MSFDFVSGDNGFQCKKCGAEIDLWRYRRLALCETCEGPIVAAAQGSPEVRAQRTIDAYGIDWDRQLIEDINEWNSKRERLR
jgi:predicted amidophosphoribosyltransferase